MMVLYDEEEIMRSYIASEVDEARREAWDKASRETQRVEKIETAKRLLQMKKLSYDETAAVSRLTVEEVEKLAKSQLI